MSSVRSRLHLRRLRRLPVWGLMACLTLAPHSISTQLTSLLPSALAQTVITTGGHSISRSKPPDRVAVAHAIAMFQQTDLCQAPVTLKVADASLQEIATQMLAALPRKTTIEIRTRNAARLTFDLKGAPADKVLQSVAMLAGCNLYVLADRWLVTSENQLSPAELAEIKEWGTSGAGRRSALTQAVTLLADFVTAELTKPLAHKADSRPANGGQSDAIPVEPVEEAPLTRVQFRFGDIAPDLQPLIQQLVTWQENRPRSSFTQSTRLHLTSATLVTLEYDAQYRQLAIKSDRQAQPGTPNPYVWQVGMSPAMQQQMEQARRDAAARRNAPTP